MKDVPSSNVRYVENALLGENIPNRIFNEKLRNIMNTQRKPDTYKSISKSTTYPIELLTPPCRVSDGKIANAKLYVVEIYLKGPQGQLGWEIAFAKTWAFSKEEAAAAIKKTPNFDCFIDYRFDVFNDTPETII